MYLQNANLSATLAPPTEEQFNKLMDYLLLPEDDPAPLDDETPLPIVVTMDNKWRWDEYKGIVHHNITSALVEDPIAPPRHRKKSNHPHDWPEMEECFTIIDSSNRSEESKCDSATELAHVALAVERLMTTITPTSPFWSAFAAQMERIQPDPKKRGRPPYFFDS